MQITEFNSPEFQLRAITINNEPWFLAKQVCDVLGLTNTTETLRRVDSEDLSSVKLNSGGQMRNMKIINESGLYQVIFMSNKPQAKAFKKWVTSEVLPSIRKTGSYILPDNKPTSDKLELSAKQVASMLSSLTKGFEILAIEVGNLNKKLERKTKTRQSSQARAIHEYKSNLKEMEIAKDIEAIISNNPGINQTNLFKKLGKNRDDKTMRKILTKYTGIRWNYKQSGRECQYRIGPDCN